MNHENDKKNSRFWFPSSEWATPRDERGKIFCSTYTVQSWPLKCAQPIKPKITPKQERLAPGAFNKKNCARLWPYLRLNVAAPGLPQIALYAGKKKVIDPPNLRNLRSVKLRQGLTKCRDRHRQAWPKICAPFWAITSSLCVAISLFVPFPHSSL